MLALTRRVGQAVRIGDGVRLTVRDRLRDLVLIDLTAPCGSALTCDGAPLLALPARRGDVRYLCSVLAGERLRLGEVGIVFRTPRKRRGQGRQVQLCIDAPRECRIRRDETSAAHAAQEAACQPEADDAGPAATGPRPVA